MFCLRDIKSCMSMEYKRVKMYCDTIKVIKTIHNYSKNVLAKIYLIARFVRLIPSNDEKQLIVNS